MILNMVPTFQDIKHGSSVRCPILEFLILQLENENDMMYRLHLRTNVYVNVF